MKKLLKSQAGLTVIELLVATVVSSILLVMLMQLVVLNVTTRRVVEYENYLTDESLLITEQIQNELIQFEPHGFVLDDTSDPNLITITFYHEYNVILDDTDPLNVTIDLDQVNDTLVLEFDRTAETISLDGNVIHSSSLKILTSSTIVESYYSDDCEYMVDAGCNDFDSQWEDRIVGDGVIYFSLDITIEYNSGTRGDTFVFETQIIV